MQISVSQVSFGSLFWPPVLEYLDELIDALIEKKAPFVSRLQLPFTQQFNIFSTQIRYFLMGLIVLNCRRNWQKELNHQVWE
jgi:hypothetical protein